MNTPSDPEQSAPGAAPARPAPASADACKPAAFEGLPHPRRVWATLTLMCGLAMAVLDSSIAHVALPVIARDLDTTAASVIWIANAYNLAVVTLLLPFSAVAERIGFRRMFTFGLALFTLASLSSALSSTLIQLTLSRVLQGVGAAAVMCLIGGFVRNIFPLRRLGFGMSINATTVAISAVVGPSIGSVILSVASWPWIFAINVPVGILAMMGIRHLPDVPTVQRRFDVLSALLCMMTLAAFIIGVDVLGANVLTSLMLFVFAGLCGTVLVRRSRVQTAPLVPIDLLRIRVIAFAAAASCCTFAAQMASYVSLPFYFHNVLGRPYIEIGLLMAAWPCGTALVATLAGRVSDKYSVAILSGAGAGAMLVGLISLIAMPASAGNGWLAAAMLVCGMGFGFFQTPNNRAMLSSAPRTRSGAAGGMQATLRVFGQSFGTALVAIAFSVQWINGPTLALIFASLCAALAVAVNFARFDSVRVPDA